MQIFDQYNVNFSEVQEESKLHLAQKREYELELNLAKIEKSHSNLKSNYQRLETTVQKINEEKLKLNLEINEHKTIGQSLKGMLCSDGGSGISTRNQQKK